MHFSDELTSGMQNNVFKRYVVTRKKLVLKTKKTNPDNYTRPRLDPTQRITYTVRMSPTTHKLSIVVLMRVALSNLSKRRYAWTHYRTISDINFIAWRHFRDKSPPLSLRRWHQPLCSTVSRAWSHWHYSPCRERDGVTYAPNYLVSWTRTYSMCLTGKRLMTVSPKASSSLFHAQLTRAYCRSTELLRRRPPTLTAATSARFS